MRNSTLVILALTQALAVPALAQDGVVVDYGDGRTLDIADPAQWNGVAEGLGDGMIVSGEVKGSFTKAGAEQVAYLASDGPIVASDPFPQVKQSIVVFENDKVVKTIALPESSAYARPVAAVDADGDGLAEVVLEGSFYNMGTQAMGIDLVKLGDSAEVLQSLPEVFVDSCEAGVGEKSITAGTVRLVDGKLVAEPKTEACG